jgi:hypothetical protein
MTEDSRDDLIARVRKLNAISDALKNRPPLSPQMVEMAAKLEERVRYLSWGDIQEQRAELQAKAALHEAGAPKSPAAQAPAGPEPLTTGDIAFCFDGLGWSETKWKKPLGDLPNWLAPCLVIPGTRGGNARRWNPVLIGAELYRRKGVPLRSVRARFQSKPALKPWLEAWSTYEADNFGAE